MLCGLDHCRVDRIGATRQRGGERHPRGTVDWTRDFNARDTSRIREPFAADLVYDYRGFPERGHAALCSLLHRSLNDPTKRFTYLLDIREIIVAGDVAIVRLVWTLRTVRKST